MRDPRFSDSEKWWKRKTAAREAARIELAMLGQLDVLVGATAILLEVDDSAWAQNLRSAIPSFSDALREDVVRFIEERHDLQQASWCAIARALGWSAVSGDATPQRLQAALDRLRLAPGWVYDEFYSACVERISTVSPAKREAWFAVLERPLEIVEPPPETGAAIQVSRRVDEWVLRDVFELWGSNVPMAIEAVHMHAPTQILRLLDADRWLRAVDGWRDARLVAGALFGDHVFHDPDALLHWLASSAITFDANEAWTGRTAAVILAHHVVRHAKMLLDAVAFEGVEPETGAQVALEGLRVTELPRFFQRAWDVLLARSDGLMIAAALHAHLSQTGRHGGRYDGMAQEIAFTTLGSSLASRSIRTGRLRSLWEARRQVRTERGLGVHVAHASGVSALLSALEVVGRGGPRDDDLFAMLLDRLQAPDADWARLAGDGALNQVLSDLLREVASTPDALERCERLYEGLEPVRRRGEYGGTYNENDADLASALVLLTLLGLIDEIGPAAGDGSLTRALQWSTRFVLTSSPAFTPTLIASPIFGYALRLCALRLPQQLPQALAVALPDPALAAVAVASLVPVLTREGMDTLLRSIGDTLEGLETRARMWAYVTNQRLDRAAVTALENSLASSP